jgi:hypothetical protein
MSIKTFYHRGLTVEVESDPDGVIISTRQFFRFAGTQEEAAKQYFKNVCKLTDDQIENEVSEC